MDMVSLQAEKLVTIVKSTFCACNTRYSNGNTYIRATSFDHRLNGNIMEISYSPKYTSPVYIYVRTP